MKFRVSLPAAVRAVAACWALSLSAEAGPLTVTWGAQHAGGALATAAGHELPPGCLVRLGFFDMSLARVQEAAFDLAYLDAHFTELAHTTVGEFDRAQFEVPGSFADTFTADSTRLPPQIATRAVCMWVGNAPALDAATEIGIFTSAAWNLGAGQLGSAIWDLSQIQADGVIVGSFSPTQSPTLGGQMNQLVSVNGLWDASDLDRDGVAALLEDAFGMNPDWPDATLLPAMVSPGPTGSPTYRFRRPTGGSQLSAVVYETAHFRYIVEVSTDLRHWRVDPSSCQLLDVQSAGYGFEIVSLRPVPTLGTTPDFYRVKVERRE